MKLINKLIIWGIITVIILAIPLIAMQYTNEVNWTSFDFVFAGILILGTGFLFELARQKANANKKYKMGAGLALTTTFLLIWINGAVGIIGKEGGINMLYSIVVFILFIGSIITGFKARGLSITLYIAATVQFIIPIIAFIINQPDFTLGVVKVFILNSFFVISFIVSALLFKQSNL